MNCVKRCIRICLMYSTRLLMGQYYEYYHISSVRLSLVIIAPNWPNEIFCTIPIVTCFLRFIYVCSDDDPQGRWDRLFQYVTMGTVIMIYENENRFTSLQKVPLSGGSRDFISVCFSFFTITHFNYV